MSAKMKVSKNTIDSGFVPFGLKLHDNDRESFKVITRKNGTTMQAVLEAFVRSYIANPDKFELRVSMELKIQ